MIFTEEEAMMGSKQVNQDLKSDAMKAEQERLMNEINKERLDIKEMRS